jgi:hypothetical protein
MSEFCSIQNLLLNLFHNVIHVFKSQILKLLSATCVAGFRSAVTFFKSYL